VRVALMAMADRGGQPVRLAGRSLSWHQLQTAIALGCERIVCLADAPGPALAALQREAERCGTKFHAIAHSRALLGLVSGADTLYVFAPEVLPDSDWAVQALGARAGIAVLPADGAVERGFERIDRERAWAGVLATRGDAVEALADLPADADPIAGLLRVALQRGGRSVEIPGQWLDEERWLLLADAASAQRAEERWQTRHVSSPPFERPGERLAHGLARKLLARSAEAPMLAPGLTVGGMALAAAGGATGYAGYLVGGLATLTLGSLVAKIGERLRLLAQAGSRAANSRGAQTIGDAILDVSLLAVGTSPQAYAGWMVPFVLAVLIAAIRMAREETAQRPLRPLGDRTLVLALLTLGAAAGAVIPLAAALGLTGLGARLFWPRRSS